MHLNQNGRQSQNGHLNQNWHQRQKWKPRKNRDEDGWSREILC